MKIKQVGKIQPWNLDVTCSKCEATITLESPHDMSVIQLRSTKQDIYYAICPICGGRITLEPQNIREDILKAIDWIY